jgi:hypothetical protein
MNRCSEAIGLASSAIIGLGAGVLYRHAFGTKVAVGRLGLLKGAL